VAAVATSAVAILQVVITPVFKDVIHLDRPETESESLWPMREHVVHGSATTTSAANVTRIDCETELRTNGAHCIT
jgi:hypothetical protein